VRSSRALGDSQRRGDALVRFARSQQAQDLELPGGELLRTVVARTRPERSGQLPRDRRIELQLAAVSGPDRHRDLIGVRILEEETGGPGFERSVHALVLAERREHDDLDLFEALSDLARRLDAVDRLHLQVHEDDVRWGPV
jgi:hypothetical protein